VLPPASGTDAPQRFIFDTGRHQPRTTQGVDMIYQGSCHCGKIAFEVEGDIGELLACNCSICQRKGSLLWFVPRASLRLLNPAEDMRTYTFNKHAIQHRFCPTCGIHPFGEAPAPDGQAVAAVNVRCLEDIDLDVLPVKHFNGRAL
jgi:hypothetical protein